MQNDSNSVRYVWYMTYPLFSTAFCAYSTWNTRPSGENWAADKSYYKQNTTLCLTSIYNVKGNSVNVCSQANALKLVQSTRWQLITVSHYSLLMFWKSTQGYQFLSCPNTMHKWCGRLQLVHISNSNHYYSRVSYHGSVGNWTTVHDKLINT